MHIQWNCNQIIVVHCKHDINYSEIVSSSIELCLKIEIISNALENKFGGHKVWYVKLLIWENFALLVYLYIGFLNPSTECINPRCLFKPCYQNTMSNSCVFENKHFSFYFFYFKLKCLSYWTLFSLQLIDEEFNILKVFDQS